MVMVCGRCVVGRLYVSLVLSGSVAGWRVDGLDIGAPPLLHDTDPNEPYDGSLIPYLFEVGAVVPQCRTALTAGDVLERMQRLLNGRDPNAGVSLQQVSATWEHLLGTVLLILPSLGIYSTSTSVHGK